jgi:hypothetical protein
MQTTFLRAQGYFPRLLWGIFVRINNNNFWLTELHRRRDDLQKQLAKKRGLFGWLLIAALALLALVHSASLRLLFWRCSL